MKKHVVALIGSSALVISLATAGIVFAHEGDSQRISGSIPVSSQAEAGYPAMAKITFDQVMQGAIESTPGKVLKVGLKEEDGFLVYRVEVVTPDQTIMEVTLDAGNGKVLATHQDKADHHDHEREDDEHRDHEEHDDD